MIFRSDFHIDPLTGILNLFGFLETNIESAFRKDGIIIAFDIANFMRVNTEHGREVGDACVRTVAAMLIQESQRHENSAAFRLGGDEFILVLPGKSHNEADDIASRFVISYKSEMHEHGVNNAMLRTAVTTYNSGVSSLTLVKSIYMALEGTKEDAEVPQVLPKWADHIIGTALKRVYETVMLLRDAHTAALSDDISGLPNYRAANIFLEEMLNKSRVNKESCSILFIDGDNLKQYNNLGYKRGNLMIRDLANIITDNIRQGDIAARWLSGDEFIVLLPNTDRILALQVGERLRKAVDNGTQDWPFHVTISIGVSSYPEDGNKIDELIHIAEEANAEAKRKGKNLII